MENEIYAPCDGKVTAIPVTQGQQLQGGDTLMSIGGVVVAAAPAAAPVAAAPAAAAPVAPSAPAAGAKVSAPMPGLLLRFNAKKGDAVKKDQVLCVMEAMKMENEIFSPCDGTVAEVSVNQGDQLQAGDTIMVIA